MNAPLIREATLDLDGPTTVTDALLALDMQIETLAEFRIQSLRERDALDARWARQAQFQRKAATNG